MRLKKKDIEIGILDCFESIRKGQLCVRNKALILPSRQAGFTKKVMAYFMKFENQTNFVKVCLSGPLRNSSLKVNYSPSIPNSTISGPTCQYARYLAF